MTRAPRILPIPPNLADVLASHPVAFERGVDAAEAGEDEIENPYNRAAERAAWAAGWLSIKEGWLDATEIEP